jgi:hypothetical protein
MRIILLLGSALLAGFVASAQTPFQNLNFEAAVLPPVPDPNPMPPDYGRVDISFALPGWTAYVGTTPERRILYDNVFLDSAGIGIFNTNCANPMIAPFCRVLEGQYTAWLQAGYAIPFGGPYDVSIAQTGLIPDGTRTMAFMSIGSGGTDPAPSLHVSVAGQATPLYLLNTRPSFNIYGVDVSAYAGQEAAIQFTSSGHLYLDLIRFTATPVPEPSMLGLIGAAGAALASLGAWNRYRRQRSP